MDKEQEEKAPGGSAQGKTLSPRSVRSRVGSLKVEGYNAEKWDSAGVLARHFIAHVLWSAKHQPAKWSRRRPST